MDITWWLYSLAGMLLSAEAFIMGDQCDWTGSGLSSGGDRSVTPVYLRCREGRLSWLYPRGALRLIFQLPSNDQDFTVCIRVLPSHRQDDEQDLFLADDALDFRELNREDKKKEAYPARLFLEGARNLVPLYAHNDGDEREIRCFKSKRGRAAVYVEALEDLGFSRTVAALRYEARPLPRGHADFANTDCRPCSDEEMSLAFCTSDLVSRGLIVGLQQRNELDTSQLTLQLSKLIRHTDHTGKTRQDEATLNKVSAPPSAKYYKYTLDHRHKRIDKRRKKRKHREIHAHVHVPKQCGASHGDGEFMFMARRRLGRLWLTCAPRLEQWASLVDRMNKNGAAHCLLKH